MNGTLTSASERDFKGSAKTGNKGLIDVVLFEKELENRLLNVWICELGLDPSEMLVVRDVFQSHETLRAKMTEDQTWRQPMSIGGCAVVDLLVRLPNDGFKDQISTAVRSRKSVFDFCQQTIHNDLSEIADAIKAHKESMAEALREKTVSAKDVAERYSVRSADDVVMMVNSVGDDDADEDFEEFQLNFDEMICSWRKHGLDGSAITKMLDSGARSDMQKQVLQTWLGARINALLWITLEAEHNKGSEDIIKSMLESHSANVMDKVVCLTYNLLFVFIVDFLVASKATWSRVGGGSQFILFWFDILQWSESQTAPHLRAPTFDSDDVKRTLNLALTLGDSSTPKQMHQGHLHIMNDGFKPSLLTQMLNNYKDLAQDGRPLMLTKSKRIMDVAVSQKSLMARRTAANGKPGAQKLQLCAVTKAHCEIGTNIPIVDRAFVDGANFMDVIAYLDLPDWSGADCWKDNFKLKKKLLKRREVGGQSGDGMAPVKVRKNDDLEPVNFWALPWDVGMTILTDYQILSTFDLGAVEPTLALCHVFLKKPYWGIVLCEEHKQLFYARLHFMVFKCMMGPEQFHHQKNLLHDAALVRLFTGGSTNQGGLASGRAKEKTPVPPKTSGKASAKVAETLVDPKASPTGKSAPARRVTQSAAPQAEEAGEDVVPKAKGVKRESGSKAGSSKATGGGESVDKKAKLLHILKDLKGKGGKHDEEFVVDEDEEEEADE